MTDTIARPESAAASEDWLPQGTRVEPHGGRLINLVVDSHRARELKSRAIDWPSWHLTRRQLCDLEMLAVGAFSPLDGFLGMDDYRSVCASMRLADETLWPMPVTLDVPDETMRALADSAGTLALRDPEGVMLAALHVAEVWRPDRRAEAAAVFGTTDVAHHGVNYLLHHTNPWYVAGRLEVLQLPEHADFADLRYTPSELRAVFAARDWRLVVAFNTRNPMHRAHQELTLRAARETNANLLIHPVVGLTKPGDVDSATRIRCYEAVLATYPEGSAMLAVLPLAMRMGGPREALWHALIRKNYGATHFIVGRDPAGPGLDSSGRPFYGPYDAQQLARGYEPELGVHILSYPRLVYLENDDAFVPEDEIPAGAHALSISGTEVRRHLAEGREPPRWATLPEVAAELRRSFPRRTQQGFAIFFTGLSGSGKSTIASALVTRLSEDYNRYVTVLDGDLVRHHLSSELGFSREHRDLNVRRIGFVASEIVKNRGLAVCAPIAPYDVTRREVRRMVEAGGGFVLVHVATPLEVCEDRDRKGLYAKARAGLLPHFTGVSDPYEYPTDAEVVVDTQKESPDGAAQRIIDYLRESGYLMSAGSPPGGGHANLAHTAPSACPDSH